MQQFGKSMRALAAAAAMTAGLVATGASLADSGKITIGTSGGWYAELQKQYAVPVLQKEGYTFDVVFDSNDQAPRDTMMRAQKDSPVGTMDVYQGDITLQAMADEGLLEKLDFSKIPNIKYVPENLRSDYWIPQMQAFSVIIYNKEKVTPAPTSYKVLWDPQYKGKIGAFPNQWNDFFHAASTVAQGTDAKQDWDKGIPLLEQLGPSLNVLANQDQITQGMESGQIWMTLNWSSKPYMWREQGGTKEFGILIPEEGTFANVFGMGIPKNASNKDAAYAYLNAMLDPSVQQAYAQKAGYSPTVTNANIPADVAAKMFVPTADELARVHPLDLSYVAANTARWHDVWIQNVLN